MIILPEITKRLVFAKNLSLLLMYVVLIVQFDGICIVDSLFDYTKFFQFSVFFNVNYVILL